MRIEFRQLAGGLLCGAVMAVTGCNQSPGSAAANAPAPNTPPPLNTNGESLYTYDVVNAFPHDSNAFTEGLLYLNGDLLESTGLKGRSSLRRVDLKTGNVLKMTTVPDQYFAEGLAVLNNQAYQLTWTSQVGFIYDLDRFKSNLEFDYTGEGWGLTTDGNSLIMSDGTDVIRFMEPVTFKERRRIHVTSGGEPVFQLNELEDVKGEIYANVWKTEYVVRIDPQTGKVLGVIDFSGLLTPAERAKTDVLNGIAYDAAGDRLFVTGKLWPKLFEVRIRLNK